MITIRGSLNVTFCGVPVHLSLSVSLRYLARIAQHAARPVGRHVGKSELQELVNVGFVATRLQQDGRCLASPERHCQLNG